MRIHLADRAPCGRTRTMTDKKSGWQLGGSSSEAYERYMVPVHCVSRALDLIDRVGLRRGERVLDVACGTGIVARYAAQRVGHTARVTAIDLNPGMLEVARNATKYVEPPIEFLEGNAENSSLPDANFDVVFCQQALQFMPNRVAALKQMHRALVPGGRLALNVWRAAEFNLAYDLLGTALGKRIGPEAREIMRTPFVAKSVDEVRSWLQDAAFNEVRVAIRFDTVRFPSIEEFVRREIECMPVPQIQTEMNRNREAIVSDVSEGLRSYVDDYGLACHVEDYVATAKK